MQDRSHPAPAPAPHLVSRPPLRWCNPARMPRRTPYRYHMIPLLDSPGTVRCSSLSHASVDGTLPRPLPHREAGRNRHCDSHRCKPTSTPRRWKPRPARTPADPLDAKDSKRSGSRAAPHIAATMLENLKRNPTHGVLGTRCFENNQ